MQNNTIEKPDRSEAEKAVRTLLSYIGDDPDREGLVDTPKRFVAAYEEWFSGYNENPEAVLGRTFDDVAGYNDIILMKNIRIESHCEHHIAPIIGVVHIAYLPAGKVVGISKLARLAEIFSKRLQSQETLTNLIGATLDKVLSPRGVAVILDAEHQCISTRGINKQNVRCVTQYYAGLFQSDVQKRTEVTTLINSQ